MPRRPSGISLPPRPPGHGRRYDLYRVVRDGILDGHLPSGARLPSTRQAAREQSLSRTTVEDVYEQLASEGLIVRQVGRGSFVTDGIRRAKQPSRQRSVVRPSVRGEALAADRAAHEPLVLEPFNAGVPLAELFPLREWERCRRAAMSELGSRALNHCDPQGYAPLREQLARHLVQFRGVRADAHDIVIFTSTGQALLALFLLLAEQGDCVCVEDPGYRVVWSAARIAGLTPVPTPLDEAGMDIDRARLQAPDARLAYVTPAHQYPTGVAMSLERRQKLLAWAHERDAAVIEDDYDADFRFRGHPLNTLRSLDRSGRVLYLGTLSKAMFLGLRLSYAVLPRHLVEPLVSIRTQLDGFPPIESQATLARFIAEGRLVAHLRLIRKVYAEKLQRLKNQLAPVLEQGWTLGPADAGLHFVLYEPRRGEARSVAADVRLQINTLSSYATSELPRDGLLIRFGGLADEVLSKGARVLCDAVRRAARR